VASWQPFKPVMQQPVQQQHTPFTCHPMLPAAHHAVDGGVAGGRQPLRLRLLNLRQALLRPKVHEAARLAARLDELARTRSRGLGGGGQANCKQHEAEVRGLTLLSTCKQAQAAVLHTFRVTSSRCIQARNKQSSSLEFVWRPHHEHLEDVHAALARLPHSGARQADGEGLLGVWVGCKSGKDRAWLMGPGA